MPGQHCQSDHADDLADVTVLSFIIKIRFEARSVALVKLWADLSAGDEPMSHMVLWGYFRTESRSISNRLKLRDEEQ